MTAEIYEAVDGNTLSENFLKKIAPNYEDMFLTKGEIGCALSHINLYKKIVRDGLDYALILEDDAVLGDNLNDFLAAFEMSKCKKEGIYLLTGDLIYDESQKQILSSFIVHPVKWAIRATGYIITKRAAKTLINFLLPVKFEADMYEIFRSIAGVPIYATLPHIVSTNDKDKTHSSLEGGGGATWPVSATFIDNNCLTH